jgi:hypothetical protein
MNKVGIRAVITSSVNRLDMHQFNTPSGPMYGMTTMDYRHYTTLEEQRAHTPPGDAMHSVMMDYDDKTIVTPLFATEEAAINWGMSHFPHLACINLIDANKGAAWTISLMSGRMINKLWVAYARTGSSYPDVDKPAWVDALKVAQDDEFSGGFL